MIASDRDRLTAFSKQRTLHIRQREVELCIANVSVLTRQAAFLATIAFINLRAGSSTINLFIANACVALYSSCAQQVGLNGQCCICRNASAPCFAHTEHGGLGEGLGEGLGAAAAAAAAAAAPHGSSRLLLARSPPTVPLLTTAAGYPDCVAAGGACVTIHAQPNPTVELAFKCCSCVCGCLSLSAVAVATYAMIYGPSLAIHGPEGSMTRAIDAMHTMRRFVLRAFFGALCFALASIPLLGFMKLDARTASLMALVAAATMLAVAVRTNTVRRKFSFDMEHTSKSFLVGKKFDPEMLVSHRARTTGVAARQAHYAVTSVSSFWAADSEEDGDDQGEDIEALEASIAKAEADGAAARARLARAKAARASSGNKR